ncbi:SEN1 N terminal-domain-containing protein [Dipodascopsis tothii]|uniref:SEN1 N terminal-domain-containing protein n=1 Tax=Dipodascopsis tothii TaxID=44089 RepID=UPI0034D0193F
MASLNPRLRQLPFLVRKLMEDSLRSPVLPARLARPRGRAGIKTASARNDPAEPSPSDADADLAQSMADVTLAPGRSQAPEDIDKLITTIMSDGPAAATASAPSAAGSVQPGKVLEPLFVRHFAAINHADSVRFNYPRLDDLQNIINGGVIASKTAGAVSDDAGRVYAEAYPSHVRFATSAFTFQVPVYAGPKIEFGDIDPFVLASAVPHSKPQKIRGTDFFSYKLYESKHQRIRLDFPGRGTIAKVADEIVRSCNGVIGFDMEWTTDSKIDVIQLASENAVGVFRTSGHRNLHTSLADIIQDPKILKVGVGVINDMRKLYKVFGLQPRGFMDLADFERVLEQHGLSGATAPVLALRKIGFTTECDLPQLHNFSRQSNHIGLSALANRYTGLPLDKGMQRSVWNREKLTARQREYAANDAYAGVKIFYGMVDLIWSEYESRVCLAEYWPAFVRELVLARTLAPQSSYTAKLDQIYDRRSGGQPPKLEPVPDIRTLVDPAAGAIGAGTRQAQPEAQGEAQEEEEASGGDSRASGRVVQLGPRFAGRIGVTDELSTSYAAAHWAGGGSSRRLRRRPRSAASGPRPSPSLPATSDPYAAPTGHSIAPAGGAATTPPGQLSPPPVAGSRHRPARPVAENAGSAAAAPAVDPELQAVLDLIKESHRNVDNEQLQESALQASLKYLSALPSKTHLFCGPAKVLATEALQLFALPDSGALTWLKTTLSEQLRGCFLCAKSYQQCKLGMKKVMLDELGYDEENVDEFFQIMSTWDRERLSIVLAPAVELCKTKDVTANDISKAFNALYECLYAPYLLEDYYFQEKFSVVFLGIQSRGRFLRLSQELVPAMIEFLFIGRTKLRVWAERSLRDLSRKFTVAEFDATVLTAFERSVRKAMARRDDEEFMASFWACIALLVDKLDKGVIVNKCCGTPEDIVKFLWAEIQTYPPHIAAILQCFAALLRVLGTDFWDMAAPFVAQNFTDTIFNNPSFESTLRTTPAEATPPPVSGETPKPAMSDFLGWIEPFLQSLTGTVKQRSSDVIAAQLLIKYQDGSYPAHIRHEALAKGLTVLALSLDFPHESTFVDNEVNKIMKLEARTLADKYSKLVVDAFAQQTGAVRASALSVVTRCLSLDVFMILGESIQIHRKQFTASSLVYHDSFWKSLAGSDACRDVEFAHAFVWNVAQLASAEKAIVGDNAALKPGLTRFNTVLGQVAEAAAGVLRRIRDQDTGRLRQLVASKKTVQALMTASFAAELAFSQASLDIIKECYDVTGRLEGVRALFAADMQAFIEAYVAAIKDATTFGVFGPIPRLIRTTMDLVEVLFDGRTGYVAATGRVDEAMKQPLVSFWKRIWWSLSYIYKRTLFWATVYPKDSMIDFMRDVLDLSNSLFSNVQILGQVLASQDLAALSLTASEQASEQEVVLLEMVIEPLRTMSQWLRLSDVALLTSCCKLVSAMLNRFGRTNVQLPLDIFTLLDNLAHKAKRHRNNLDEAQCSEIIIALSIFEAESAYADDESSETSSVLKDDSSRSSTPSAASDKKRASKLDGWLKPGADVDVKVEPKAERPEARRQADERARKKGALMAFAVPVAELPAKEKAAPAKSELINNMRAELAEKRRKMQEAQAAALPVHPPRPAGFRSRDTSSARQTPTSAAHSDDSSSEYDSDTEGLFQLSKAHTTALSKPAVPAVRSRTSAAVYAGARRTMAPVMSDKERAERNMRARLHVNLGPLYQRILNWDLHAASCGIKEETLQAVPGKFKDAQHYKSVFEPLLMLECWQSMQRSKEEKQEMPFRVGINSRAACDEYVEISASIETATLATVRLGDSDMLLLTYDPFGAAKAKEGGKTKYPGAEHPHCLAKVKEIKRSRSDLCDIVLRCLPNPEIVKHLLPKADLLGVRVMNMTTIEREFSSLHGLAYYDMADAITAAKPTPPPRSDVGKIKRTQSIYNVNAPQAAAIVAATENAGFTLIQGPPGTGKTKTILGIVGALVTGRKDNSVKIAIPGQLAKPPPPVEPKRILVCAPSNAAVDELVLRLKGGILDAAGQPYAPKVVRLGRGDNINASVRDLTLEELVDREVAKFEEANAKSKGDPKTSANLREQLTKVLGERDTVRKQMEDTAEQAERDRLRAQLDELFARKNQLGQQLDQERDRRAVAIRTTEIERRKIQTRILTSAEVICATLSGSGHELMTNLSLTFGSVVIDEAAQCIELSALIPLKYGCTKCIMVGDPNQLPPTVLSQAASKFLYEQSLFVRMQKNHPGSVHLLSIQYRMHPEISRFPSLEFYKGKLIDGDGMAARTAREWHASELFTPYRVFDVRSREEQSAATKSYYNRTEALVALAIYEKLTRTYADIDFDGKIGVVTPYKQQLNELKNVFRRKFGQPIFQVVDFNTIDGFQGQEKDIIIISCVRAAGGGRGVGFLSDVRRMNVGLTRAKSSMWILGHVESLVVDPVWRRLVDDARGRGLVSDSFKDGSLTVPLKRKHN